jgi:hemolysin activation/secretion protein
MKTTIPARRMSFAPRTLLTPLALCCASSLALAQPTPPQLPNYGIGDALKEVQPPRPSTAPPQAPAPQITEQPERPLSLPAGETLFVRDFLLEGAEFIPESELQALLEPYKGRTLSLAQIEEAAGKLTALYRSRGYLVARAYVPRQDASGGTLRIRVLVGRYGRFSLRNQSLVRDGLLNRIFAPLATSQAPVTRADLERSMLTVSDMPGAQLPRLTISPGEAPGSSDFEVDVPAGPRWGGWLLGDNHGSRYTGKNRLSGGVEVNSPFGIADKLSASLLGAEGGDLDNGRLAYGFPLAANGLRGEVAWAKTTYDLGGPYTDLDATGRAYTLEGNLSYPLLRSRERNLSLSLGLASRRLRDEVGAVGLVTSKEATVGTLGLRYEDWADLFGRASYTTANAGLVYGRLKFDDPEQEAYNRAGADTAGDYAYLRLGAATQLELAPRWNLSAAASVQKSLNRNLDASEQMNIAGPSGVRAYREVASGDNGYLLNAQLRYALPAPPGLEGGFTHSLGVFADLGRVYLQHGEYADVNGVRLQDAGLGYAARYKSLFGQVQVARAVGSRPASVRDESRTRVLVQLGVQF